MKADSLKLKLEEAQIPSNCTEMLLVIPWLQCTHDSKMQSIQKSYVASTTLMFKAASKLTKLLPKQDNDNVDIKTSLIEKFLIISQKI